MQPTKFRFHGGRLCLDFLATVVGRYREPVDQLSTPHAVGRWFHQAGLIAEIPEVRDSEVATVAELREAIYRLVHPDTRGTPSDGDIGTVNYFASQNGPYPVLAADARSATNCSTHPVPACLSVVAGDAIRLLSSAELAGVRECSGPDCSVLFLDASRSNQRRWCDMSRCGNQAKASRHRRRQLSGASD